jgi:large subunit ribosomal protein L6e
MLNTFRQPKKSRKSPRPPSLRSSITPGTILILLAGRYRGKQVIFLKQLASGLLFKVNGFPLRRVNQACIVATSTEVDFAGVKIDNKLDDTHFTKTALQSRRSAEEEEF